MSYRWILPLHSELAGLAQVGGKGANLALLAQAGLPLPDGFLVTTRAYCNFVAANSLLPHIKDVLEGLPGPDAALLESSSHCIRDAFRRGHIADDLAAELCQAYRALGAPSVAVRSSATAEDLPDLSFAGQQDTYLNIYGEAALLQAVVECWSSLWTARAIGYRMHNGIDHHNTALAVVVQRMVNSQVSGVLFTANPLSGHRAEMVIEAAFGLGEALVSGQVEPDQYVVDVRQNQVLTRKLGAKKLSLLAQPGGGALRYEETRKDQQALPDEEILALAQLGKQVAEHFGAPQDIEWAYSDGQFYLLQSRPITSLYPLPQNVPPEPLRVMFSFAAVQGMLDPLTPLGRETLLWMVTANARLLGIRYASVHDCPGKIAGERLWVDITTLMRNSAGRRLALAAFNFIEPTIQQALKQIWDEAGLQPQRRSIRPQALLQILRFIIPIMVNAMRNLQAPQKRRTAIVQRGEQLLDRVQARLSDLAGTPHQKLAQLAAALSEIEPVLPTTFRQFLSVVATAMATYNAVWLLSRPVVGQTGEQAWNDLLLKLTRGLPHNPTTQMNLELWQTAQAIQNNAALAVEIIPLDAAGLAARYQSKTMPAAGIELVDRFLGRYGGRGLAEIDLGRTRWREDATQVFEILLSYLQINQPELAPDVIFKRSEASAQAALDQLCECLSRQPGGWWRVRLVRFFAGRMRALMGMREAPKFFVVRLLASLRWTLLDIGQELVRDGVLKQADDLFYLTWEELDTLAAGGLDDPQAAADERRAAYQRELRRRHIPRLLLSDGRAFYAGMLTAASGAASIHGSPVSPGFSQGYVRIVLHPLQANLKPGEILVCPGTDPSWTPLFLAAAGLIMEVGGMMTHGAVVAREYGIPAIVGVDQATTRLHTGQYIRMDGSSGLVEVLEKIDEKDP
ncbi:MAG TPA: PEP/pyruvate-binding domain-containing protein [Levilinea sp.]|nr:PEP/pyruvate-binding domain-containing protein [Levilinea sp.]